MSGHAIDVGAGNFDEVVIRGSRERPVLVDFWAPWCGPCRMLTPILDKLAAEMGGRFTLAKLNTDDEQELAARHDIRGIPNVKAFVDGRVVDEFTGVLPEAGVRAFLERAIPSPAAKAVAEARSRLAAKDAVGALAKLDEVHALDPDGEDALLTRAEALVALGRGADAGYVLDALEAPARVRARPVRDERRLATLRALSALAAGGRGNLDALARRAAAEPPDFAVRCEYANALAADGGHERALELLLSVVDGDRGRDGDAAKKAMLTIFDALGPDSDLARRYRRALAAIVNR
ncbi:Chaperedoxin [Burkholderiales bacterium]|nr:Chaperedoxin [Burkholderiales bacterium]